MLGAMTIEAFLPLVVLLGLATLFSAFLSVFKIKINALFAIKITLGIIIAPWFNKLIQQNNMENVVEALYLIGFVLIMFLSGYDCDFSVFKKSEGIPIVKTVVKIFLLMYLLSFGSSFLFIRYFNGNILGGVILLTLVFATTFAGVVIPLIHVKGLAHTNAGKIISTFSTLAELVSILGLTAYMIIMRVTDSRSWLLIIIVLLLALMFLVKKRGWIRKIDEFMPGNHFSLKVIMLILLSIVLLSDLSGGEYILGAFLLGMVLKILSPPHEVMATIENISYGIFIPMFLILIGTKVDIYHFIAHKEIWLLTIILTMVIIFVKLPALYLLKWFNTKTVISTIMIISCTIIVTFAAEHIGLHLQIFDETFAEALKVASVITCIIPPLLFDWFMPINEKIKI